MELGAGWGQDISETRCHTASYGHSPDESTQIREVRVGGRQLCTETFVYKASTTLVYNLVRHLCTTLVRHFCIEIFVYRLYSCKWVTLSDG